MLCTVRVLPVEERPTADAVESLEHLDSINAVALLALFDKALSAQ